MAFVLNLENEYEKISQHSRSLGRWETEQRLPVCFEKPDLECVFCWGKGILAQKSAQ